MLSDRYKKKVIDKLHSVMSSIEAIEYFSNIRYDFKEEKHIVHLEIWHTSLTFDALEKLSKKFKTKDINIESEYDEGYYGEVDKYVKLTIKCNKLPFKLPCKESK